MLAPLPDFWFNDATGQLKIMGNFQLGDVIVVECWTKSYIDVDKMVGNTAGYGTAGPETSWTLPDVYDNPDKRLT
ncbi:hypothetical protein ACXWOG_11000, partial [Streptococcus pyogenes]